MKGVTLYSGLSKFYFRQLLMQIVKIGKLDREGITILDFGCGKGELKRILTDAHVIGYDIIPSLNDVTDWRSVDFDVLVANEVFYSFNEYDLDILLNELRTKNRALEIVVGISRLGLLNNIGKYLLGRADAHSATQIGPRDELAILEKYCNIKNSKNEMNLANVYSLSFK